MDKLEKMLRNADVWRRHAWMAICMGDIDGYADNTRRGIQVLARFDAIMDGAEDGLMDMGDPAGDRVII